MGKKKRKLAVAAVVLVVAAVIRLVNKLHPDEDVLMTDLIRCALHIGLFTAWGLSLSRRVVQKQARRYLCGVVILMVLWNNLKLLKYYIVTDMDVDRYLWYLYYLPMVYIPLFMLHTSLLIGKTEDYRLPKWAYALHVPALLIFLMVMTNDLHEFVFSFPMHDFSPDNYAYRPGYFLAFGWFAACTLAALWVLYACCRGNRRYRKYFPLLVSLALTLIYFITYLLEIPLTRYLAGDLSITYGLLLAAILESSIYCGLIPTNTRYDEMFVSSAGNSAQIVDAQYRVRYTARQAEAISTEKMKEAENRPVLISGERILHNMPISGGYAIWTEDISRLARLRRELTEAQEELTERNAILQYEYELEKERKTVEEQNRLYDLLASSTQKQIDQIGHLMKAYERAEGDAEKGNEILSRIAVLGSYVKRKKHLMLSVSSGFDIAEGELKNALGESARYLQLMGVRCAVFVDTGKKYLPGNMAVLAYDFFEAAVEAALDSLFAVTVTVCVVQKALRVRLVIGCGADLRVLSAEYPQAEIGASDEEEWTLILPLKGGDAR